MRSLHQLELELTFFYLDESFVLAVLELTVLSVMFVHSVRRVEVHVLTT